MKIKEKEFVEITLAKLYRQRSYLWKSELERLELIKSKSFPIERLFETYVLSKKYDFLSHLRQISIYFRSPIKLPEDAFFWASTDKKKFGFNIDIQSNSVSAKPYAMETVEDFKYEYVWAKKRFHKESFPDPALYNLFGYCHSDVGGYLLPDRLLLR